MCINNSCAPCDILVLEALIRDFGLHAAAQYASKIAQVPGGGCSAQYARIADALWARVHYELFKELDYLREVAQLPRAHLTGHDLGNIPL